MEGVVSRGSDFTTGTISSMSLSCCAVGGGMTLGTGGVGRGRLAIGPVSYSLGRCWQIGSFLNSDFDFVMDFLLSSEALVLAELL